jgi:hypothetical protein
VDSQATAVSLEKLARPRGETSNSIEAERLFAKLVEWTEYLKGRVFFLNPPEASS